MSRRSACSCIDLEKRAARRRVSAATVRERGPRHQCQPAKTRGRAPCRSRENCRNKQFESLHTLLTRARRALRPRTSPTLPPRPGLAAAGLRAPPCPRRGAWERRFVTRRASTSPAGTGPTPPRAPASAPSALVAAASLAAWPSGACSAHRSAARQSSSWSSVARPAPLRPLPSPSPRRATPNAPRWRAAVCASAGPSATAPTPCASAHHGPPPLASPCRRCRPPLAAARRSSNRWPLPPALARPRPVPAPHPSWWLQAELPRARRRHRPMRFGCRFGKTPHWRALRSCPRTKS